MLQHLKRNFSAQRNLKGATNTRYIAELQNKVSKAEEALFDLQMEGWEIRNETPEGASPDDPELLELYPKIQQAEENVAREKKNLERVMEGSSLS